ncbi:MAG TPA: YtcA family lipoprotein [Verrucomicrobiae bacterium]
MKFLKFIFIWLPIGLMLSGCGADDHSPTVDILGSYFPAWIICIVLGLALTLITRQVLIGLKLNTHLHPAPLVYICMLVSFTLTLWLALFQN